MLKFAIVSSAITNAVLIYTLLKVSQRCAVFRRGLWKIKIRTFPCEVFPCTHTDCMIVKPLNVIADNALMIGDRI